MSRANPSLNGFRQVWPLDGLRSGLRIGSSQRTIVALVGLTLLIALLAIASRLAIDPERFPVKYIDVVGTMDYTDRNLLGEAIKHHTARGFYGLDIDSLRSDVESIEWIASARVNRVWPARISIDVHEHEPAARWNDDHLISKTLELFKPYQLIPDSAEFDQWSEVFEPLPQVLGSLGRHGVLLDSYRSFDLQLSRFDLKLTLLEEDERLSQTLTLSNGVSVKLGREQQELRMSRFLDVYERLANKASDKPLSFDMRYSNGFALGGVAPADSGTQE